MGRLHRIDEREARRRIAELRAALAAGPNPQPQRDPQPDWNDLQDRHGLRAANDPGDPT